MILRRAVLLLASLAGTLVLGIVAAPPAAADGDAIEQLNVDYRLDTDGVLHVTETWDWSIAPGSSRSGMQRALLVREPDEQDPRYDIGYRILDFEVSSPTDAATDHTVDSRTDPGGRVVRDIYRIGDPDRTPSGRVRYRLSYRVATVVRGDREDGYDAVAWWSPELVQRPAIDTLRLIARIPGGTDQVDCQLRGPGPRAGCGALQVDTEASPTRIRLTEHGVQPADAVHLRVLIEPGVIADNELTRTRHRSGPHRLLLAGGAVVGGGATVLVLLVLRRRTVRAST